MKNRMTCMLYICLFSLPFVTVFDPVYASIDSFQSISAYEIFKMADVDRVV